jgi:hypothetical protein
MRHYPVYVRVDGLPSGVKVILGLTAGFICIKLAANFLADALFAFADPILAFWDSMKLF